MMRIVSVGVLFLCALGYVISFLIVKEHESKASLMIPSTAARARATGHGRKVRGRGDAKKLMWTKHERRCAQMDARDVAVQL